MGVRIELDHKTSILRADRLNPVRDLVNRNTRLAAMMTSAAAVIALMDRVSGCKTGQILSMLAINQAVSHVEP